MYTKKMSCFYLLLLAVIMGCKQQKTEAPLQERTFVVSIAPGEQKLQEYLDHHQHIWPEVEAGFKRAGYKKITLSRFEHLVVMSIVVPAGADLDRMSKAAESYDKRCAEWNRLMDSYQEGVPGTTPGQKWVEVKPFYSFGK
ncbi:L-rhamnose mutarotase [Niabella drilacis]|uniref:L-rhamnose mutarotase n=1 Tax=Niabella drilacis (strain DSM 25811 / CCM 8410 / CCUG 62505 / LMG 26954 / E90) TaxID=1285928 RepID=A0A1G6R466_NIADE|nr:L-rhamnose mutarotase [Niabella drilacis]SDC99193.1 L-rhamnose mutarotase [Niabella drilacis]